MTVPIRRPRISGGNAGIVTIFGGERQDCDDGEPPLSAKRMVKLFGAGSSSGLRRVTHDEADHPCRGRAFLHPCEPTAPPVAAAGRCCSYICLVGRSFFSAGELATVQLERIEAFVPIYPTVVFVNDLITAVLLFNQFSSQRSAFTTKTHGMGLSICRLIIDAHGGQLWVTADKGRGAVFQFTVPVDPGNVTADRSSA